MFSRSSISFSCGCWILDDIGMSQYPGGVWGRNHCPKTIEFCNPGGWLLFFAWGVVECGGLITFFPLRVRTLLDATLLTFSRHFWNAFDATLLVLPSNFSNAFDATFLFFQGTFDTLLMLRSWIFQSIFETLLMLRSWFFHVTLDRFLMLHSWLFHALSYL